jgi:hypothetical protein
LDADGDNDVVLSHWLGMIEVLVNDGKGTFESICKISHPTSTGAALADFDGDGAIDIVASRLGGMSAVWWNDGHGQFTQSNATEAVLDGVSVAAGDLDGDKDVDLFFTTLTGDQLVLNAGGRKFEPPRNYVGGASSETVRLADLDGDGDIDAVTSPGFRFGTRRRIWVNDGNAHFTPGPELTEIHSTSMAIGDVDGDGLPDLLFANRAAADDLWLNRLPKVAKPTAEPATGSP